MTWFAAHTIIAVKKKISHQGPIFVYENIVLIEANSHDEARAKASIIAIEEAEGGEFTINDEPGIMIFAGIRKTVTVSNPWEHDPSQDSKQPTSGTEITYSEFMVENEEDLNRLARGESVTLEYIKTKSINDQKD